MVNDNGVRKTIQLNSVELTQDQRDEIESSGSDNGDSTENLGNDPDTYNELENFTTMNQILRDGEITVNQFIESQENDTDISSSQKKFLQINGVKCVKVKRRKNGLVFTNYLPVLSWALGKAAAWSLHFDLQHFHHSARQIIKRLKKDFFIMNENKLLAEIKSCYNCQISTIESR